MCICRERIGKITVMQKDFHAQGFEAPGLILSTTISLFSSALVLKKMARG